MASPQPRARAHYEGLRAFADRIRWDRATFPRLAVSMVTVRTGIDVTTHTRAA